jgi:N-acetyl-beta-hexosaminidase
MMESRSVLCHAERMKRTSRLTAHREALARALLIMLSFFLILRVDARDELDALMPVRGFCISAPGPRSLDAFVTFVEKELAPRHVNTLILRVDYRYQFKSHPEMADSGALSAEDVKKLVAVCRTNKIRLIPHINLLGHQSWATTTGKLLKLHPEFDETPEVKMPEQYKWPNPDGLYCKSYCPLHPKVHDAVFPLIDELCEAFEADAFHAGMDEVFYIGNEKCPRCAGRDKGALFAGEVTTIHDHLAKNGRQLWIWGDRLLDGKKTGLGEWEASYSDTWRAIRLIPKDVTICDWHYERAVQTPIYFATNGLKVVTCGYQSPKVSAAQARDMIKWRKSATAELKERYSGVMQTAWSDAGRFLSTDYAGKATGKSATNNAWTSLQAMFDEIPVRHDNP